MSLEIGPKNSAIETLAIKDLWNLCCCLSQTQPPSFQPKFQSWALRKTIGMVCLFGAVMLCYVKKRD